VTISLSGVGVWCGAFRFAEEKSAREAAAAAEDLGYTALWLPDAGGEDLFPRLAALLEATERIVVATGILNLWMHDAATVSARYAELAERHPDRLLIGIGISHAPFIEATGVGTYTKPVAKMNSYLDELDAIGALTTDARILAALGPKMLQTARDRSLGAHPYNSVAEHTATARAALGPGKLLAPEVAVVLETDPETARNTARTSLEVYFGLPNYLNNWRRFGFTEEEIAPPGSDRLIDELIPSGDEQTVAAKLGAHRDAGADHICIQVLTGDSPAAAMLEGKEPAGPAFPVEQWRWLAPVLIGDATDGPG